MEFSIIEFYFPALSLILAIRKTSFFSDTLSNEAIVPQDEVSGLATTIIFNFNSLCPVKNQYICKNKLKYKR